MRGKGFRKEAVMTNGMKRIAKYLVAGVAVIALALLVTACGSKVPLTGETTEDGIMTFTVDGCKEDDLAAIGYTIEEGQMLVVSSELTSGTLHITFSESALADESSGELETEDLEEALSGDVVLIYDASGTNEERLDLEPGDYMISVCGDDADPATGTVTITPKDKG